MLLFHVFHRLCAGLFGEARLAGVRRLQFDPQVPGYSSHLCSTGAGFHEFHGTFFRVSFSAALQPVQCILRNGLCDFNDSLPSIALKARSKLREVSSGTHAGGGYLRHPYYSRFSVCFSALKARSKLRDVSACF